MGTRKNNERYVLPNLQSTTLQDIPLNDPLNELIQNQLAPSMNIGSRRTAVPIDVNKELWEETIKSYIKQGSWRTLAAFAKQQISLTSKDDIESLLNLWCYRLFSLVKVKLYQIASSELEKLGDLFSKEFDYEAHPNLFPERKGSMVPFLLHIIWARLPSYLGDKTLSIDRFFFLINRCREATVTYSENVTLWSERAFQLSLILVNYLIELEDFSQATEILQILIDEDEANVTLQHFLFRLHLHGGNLAEAKAAFLKFEKLTAQYPCDEQTLFELKIDETLLLMAQKDWKKAQEIMTLLLETKPDNYTISNNFAVCSLYLCNLPKAVQTFQSSISSQQPLDHSSRDAVTLIEKTISNLVNLYELNTQNHIERKRDILDQVHSSLGDGFAISSFKLS